MTKATMTIQTIEMYLDDGVLAADPADVTVTTASTISWTLGAGVDAITAVTIEPFDGGPPWPYAQPTGPAADGSWHTLDEDSEAQETRYKYTVTARIGDAEQTYDPIIDDDPER